MANALAKINREIKRQKRLHPKLTHKQAQKKAASLYRAGRLGRVRHAVKKKIVRKKTHSRRLKVGAAKPAGNGQDRFDSKRVNITVGSIASQESRLRNTLAEKIGWYEAMKVQSIKAKNKNAIQKKINVLKHKLRKLQ